MIFSISIVKQGDKNLSPWNEWFAFELCLIPCIYWKACLLQGRFRYGSEPVNGGVVVSLYYCYRIARMWDDDNGMIITDPDMVAVLDCGEIFMRFYRCIFAEYSITDLSGKGDTAIAVHVLCLPEIEVVICPCCTFFLCIL